MEVQAVFFGEVYGARALRYGWAEDGTVILALECQVCSPSAAIITFADLLKELRVLCQWQLTNELMIGIKTAFVEVLTLYHEFDLASDSGHTLMLICTPPDEYFEFTAA
jgi:hypothetical protein